MRPLDLDVAVPPGSALEWTRAFPALSPRRGPLFPTTPGPQDEDPGPGRTRALPSTVELEVRVPSSFGLMRILTWDLAAHLEWVRGGWPELARPRTGPLARALPKPSEPFYWVCLAPLLRAGLHPALVSEPEVIAHLVELGEPVLPVLEIAREASSLRELCDEARTRIAPSRGGSRTPLRDAEDPERDLLLRFVFGELIAAHPYDPDAGFGARLFLLGDALAPYVAAYTRHPDPFARRNATAALARFETRDAAETLLALARESDDPVVRLRALSGLGRFPAVIDVSPLVERFEATNDPVERAALAGLFAARGSASAAPALFRAAKAARRQDVDLLTTYLWALAQIPAGEELPDLDAFLEDLARAARRKPRVFRERGGGGRLAPDVPDPPETRGRLVYQLAVLARTRRAPGDAELAREVRELSRGDRLVGPAVPGSGDARIGAVLPAAQFLWIDALGRDPEGGHALLEALARDASIEAALRLRALSRLPGAERDRIAGEILDSDSEAAEAKVFALELLDADRSGSIEPRARALLARCAAAAPGVGEPSKRYLYLAAVRALADRDRLTAEDLLPLVRRHVAAGGGGGAADLRARVHELAEAVVELARRKRGKREVEEAIARLVDFAIEARINPELGEGMREVAIASVRGMLTSLRSRRDDGRAALVTERIVDWLYDWGAYRWGLDNTRIQPPVPLEETLLVALGRTREPAAVRELERLAREPRHPQRAVACLALGIAGDPAAVATLAHAMLADDPFTRLTAWLAARHLSGVDHRADWLDGPIAERSAAAERYLAWSRAHR